MLASVLLVLVGCFSQGKSTADSTTSSFHLGAYADAYYSSSVFSAEKFQRPYFVSSALNNQANLNLVYLEASFRSPSFRFNVSPGFGTYMEANYASEKGIGRHLLLANAGIRVSKKLDAWIEAGVLDSPYSSEGPISRDQLLYSRSLAPEHVPYYLSGVRLSVTPHEKWTIKLLALTGWQQINDVNEKKSFASTVIFKPNPTIEWTYNTYFGDERSAANPEFRNRIFHDLYVKVKTNPKWESTAGFYFGTQEKNNQAAATWWQANLMSRRTLSDHFSLSGRIEYFSDPKQVLLRPTGQLPFQVFSSGLCLNLKLGKRSLFRIDGRYFKATDQIFGPSGPKKNNDLLLTTSLTSWL
ncbi:MAG: hypothetical protein RL161_335 [Bacteroidota bacterium]|jgi:hypothetical protein